VTTTPEVILARFAAAYKDHDPGAEYRLRITCRDGSSMVGYVAKRKGVNQFFLISMRGIIKSCIYPERITRIDYSNARYRGAQPLFEREG
jgi:hypothetical protein